MADYSVRIGIWSNDERGIRSVREAVFIEEQGVPEELEWDGLDTQCIHAVAEATGGQIIGTARLHPKGHLGRMSVLEPWCHLGIGTALLQALIDEALGTELTVILLHAQTSAISFYAIHGFEVFGPEFEEAGIPHRQMTRELTG